MDTNSDKHVPKFLITVVSAIIMFFLYRNKKKDAENDENKEELS